MFRFVIFAVVSLLAAAFPASAHHDPGLLGHHWEVPDYASELRLQMAMMLSAACLAGLFRLVKHAARAKKRRMS